MLKIVDSHIDRYITQNMLASNIKAAVQWMKSVVRIQQLYIHKASISKIHESCK